MLSMWALVDRQRGVIDGVGRQNHICAQKNLMREWLESNCKCREGMMSVNLS